MSNLKQAFEAGKRAFQNTINTLPEDQRPMATVVAFIFLIVILFALLGLISIAFAIIGNYGWILVVGFVGYLYRKDIARLLKR